MTQTLVPAVATPLTLSEAIGAFCSAWPTVVTIPATGSAIGVLTAQSALETGNWQKMQCFNFGNERPGVGYDGLITQYRCNEIVNGRTVWYDPPDPESTFRAFESAADGAAAHIFFLAHRSRYAQAWLRLLAGDPLGYVQALKTSGYFTGDEKPYEHAVTSICAKVTPIAVNVLAGYEHGITPEDTHHVDQMVALWLDGQARDDAEPFPLPEDS